MRGNSDRFYIKDGLGGEMICVEDPRLLKQWRKVLRLQIGDAVKLFDGSGWEYNYELRITNYECRGTVPVPKTEEITLGLINKKFTEEPKTKLILYFGILKNNNRTEWLIEKCTELGVDEFQPLVCENSQIDHLKNRSRLEKKIIEACEQSGRVRVPMINYELRITNYELYPIGHKRIANYEITDDALNICLDICNDLSEGRGGVFPPKTEGKDIKLFIGPEGGWSDQEKKYFQQNNFQFCQINENILRAETAAVVAAGMLKNIS